jgi:uncharacterized protein YlxW (UPF0749 family)
MSETIIGLIAAAIAALGSYLVTARKLSGSVGSSDAEQLWRESRSMRDEYRARIAELVEENNKLRERVAVLEAQVRLEQGDAPDYLS